MQEIAKRLVSILGKRAFLSLGVVTFLITALLSAVNITSRYALKLYVEDQLSHTPWDVALYDQSGGEDPALANRLQSLGGIRQIERMVFLRANFSTDVSILVDAKPLATPWLCLLSASDLNLLPPQLRLAMGQSGGVRSSNGQEAEGGILALVGPESAMGSAFQSLQGAEDFAIQVRVNNKPRDLFSTPLREVIRLDASQLNRWFMDQTGSVTMVPPIATILLMPYRSEVVRRFDVVAKGHVPSELMEIGETPNEVQEAEYIPEVAYLARVDRSTLVSGWDVSGSLTRFTALRDRARNAIHDTGSNAVVDSTVLVLLERMDGIAKLIGLLTFLIALPLLCMSWLLAANLSGLLMLNERRTLGLMRLRGIPGELMGRSFLMAISTGGLLGGILGLLVGSVVPLIIYERGHLPLSVLTDQRQIYISALFLIVTLTMVLLVSRRLIRYATRISPLEASARIAISEASHVDVRFGPLELLSFLLGAYSLAGWVFNFSLSSRWPGELIRAFDRILNFIGLPLFIYGIVCLLVSQRSWIEKLLTPLVRPLGGRLGTFALRQVELKPHRTLTFLLIVALMTAVSIYPAVAGPSFEDKAVRGARVEAGTEWQLTFNAPDLVAGKEISKTLSLQLETLRPGIQKISSTLKDVSGVDSVTTMTEAILPHFYIPGYGLRGVPLYLIGDPDDYLHNVYSERELGLGDPFKDIVLRFKSGDVGVSPRVADFWSLSRGAQVPLGTDENSKTIMAKVAGVLGFLPGMPLRSVTDRQGYVQARIDYLNYLFNTDAYLVASGDDPTRGNMQVLIPRIVVLVKMAPGISSSSVRDKLLRALPVAPLEVHDLDEEIEKMGSDMFIYLASANMKLYLVGGFLLALISILAIALVNYSEDRRTLALVRIRGASPNHIRRFLIAVLLSPALLGVVLGGVIAVVAGYGLSNYIWKLREIKTIVQLLSTHLVISSLTVVVSIVILVVLVGVVFSFSQWVFRRTARENIREG